MSYQARGQVPVEEKEQKVIERRRRLEEERKKRIFNARIRTTGKDVEALEQQMKEKEEMKQQEQDEEAAWTRQLEHNEKFMAKIEAERALLRKQQEDETRAYNLEMARRKEEEKQRLFNMDKEMEQTQITSHSVSGATEFAGEDPEAKQREKDQARQLKEWADQVAAEKLLAKQQEEEEERMFEQQTMALERRRARLEEQARQARADQARQTREYNLWLAEQKKQREQEEREAEEAEAQRQMEYEAHSALLTETTHESALGAGRKIPYEFKGMSADEIEQIRQENARLMAEKEEQKKQEEQEERLWMEQMAHLDGMASKSVARMDLQRKRQTDEVRQTNLALAGEHQQRVQYEEKVLYKNEIDPSFYDRFNTTTR
eukprot:TRINITY_DN15216_c0_g1_i1.p2 TRINITY_DN15216_c0_g1~~TRINITY_DN15216_c0_g1_i1.p2  ORF type:complete len:382 (+),score=161.66 TRINITY_DN15216_c0_g1_i1:23-1147(+)